MKRIVLVVVLLALAGVVVAGRTGSGAPQCAPGASGGWQAQSVDGVCLQGYEWQPPGETRAVVVIVHGLRDHAARYETLAKELQAKGFAVYARDHRGHGRSGGAHQRFASIQQLVDDLDGVVDAAEKQHPGKPVFLFGHSLGGLVATQYTLSHQARLSGLVLSGAALKLPGTVKSVEVSAAKWLGSALPELHIQQLDDTQFVTTDEAKRALAADPLVDHANLPAVSAKATIEGIDAVHAQLWSLTVPVLAMHATLDTATNPEGSQELIEKASSKDKTFKSWEGQRHDLLHEPLGSSVAALVVSWLEQHAPLAPVPAENATP